jgi:hypothetical protein
MLPKSNKRSCKLNLGPILHLKSDIFLRIVEYILKNKNKNGK